MMRMGIKTFFTCLIAINIIVITTGFSLVISLVDAKWLPKAVFCPVWLAIDVEVFNASSQGDISLAGEKVIHVLLGQKDRIKQGSFVFLHFDRNVLLNIGWHQPNKTVHRPRIEIGASGVGNFLDREGFGHTFGRRFPGINDLKFNMDRLIFAHWLDRYLLNGNPRSMVDAHGMELIVKNRRSDDSYSYANDSQSNRPICGSLNFSNRVVMIFIFSCLGGLAIGLYVLNKGEELLAKTIKRTSDLPANIGNAVTYIGNTICLFAPIAAFLWVFWQIVVCHIPSPGEWLNDLF